MKRTFNSISEIVDFVESFDGYGIVATDSDLLAEEIANRADFESLPFDTPVEDEEADNA